MLGACAQLAVDRASPRAETIEDVPAFEGLRSEWSALLGSRPSSSIFLTWEWMFTWWKHLAEGRRLSILAIRERGELIAIAPLCVAAPAVLRARPFPSIQFLGAGSVGSDYLDLIVRPGREQAAEEVLAGHLAGLRRPLDWAQVERGPSSADRIARMLTAGGWRVRGAETNVCPFIPLAGHTWESYLATLGSEHRYNFRRKWRRLNQDHTVSFEQAATPGECREAVDVVIKLHLLRFSERGGSDAFHTPGLVDFHRDWSAIALERGWLRLYVLRVDGKPAAALYGFLYRKTFYFYQAGFDPAYGKSSVGLLIMGLAIQRAIEEGAEEYDLLHGNEDYKSHWSRHERKLGRLELNPPGVRGWISGSVLEFGRTAKHMISNKWWS
jgi:CelD/BcsL family acetyltransferase involved in cellulose biosynthesis